MFVAEIDLRGGSAPVQSPRGIAGLAVDPASLLDACTVEGAGLRPGGLWQPRGGGHPTAVSVKAHRPNLDSRFDQDLGTLKLRVFEPGDAIVVPPRRLDYDVDLTVDLTAGAWTLIRRIPFAGRRALLVALQPPGVSTCQVKVVGRAPHRDAQEIADVLDTYSVTAAPDAGVVSPELAAKNFGEGRYLGGTDSLEMWPEVQVFANAGATGTHLWRFTASDEAGG